MPRLAEVLLALVLVGLAVVLIGPVAATMLTPGWLETADVRDWAGMTFFLTIAAAFILAALRLVARRPSGRAVLRARDWWVLVALAVLATLCVAVASHWMIALPGLLPVTAAVLLARRRARRERLVLVESDSADLPPRASFTGHQSSGLRPM